MNDITRYEINEHGEIPLSYGRYVRWEDFIEIVEKLEAQLEMLEDSRYSYDSGYDDGFADAKDMYEKD